MLTKKNHETILALMASLTEQQVPAIDAVASWNGRVHFGATGLDLLSKIVSVLRAVDEWKTYPTRYLETRVIHALFGSQTERDALALLKSALADGLGIQKTYFPLWGFGLRENVSLQFGESSVSRLGVDGVDEMLIGPLKSIRAEVSSPDPEIARFSKQMDYFPNVPMFQSRYRGASTGALDVVNLKAERVCEFIQFLIAWKVQQRTDIRIVDHRGAYFGRFMTVGAVVTYDDEGEPIALNLPNARGNPYSVEIDAEDFECYRQQGFLDLAVLILDGPSNGDTAISMLLRAIQLFSDGERAVSSRQAVASYIGACDALFGKTGDFERYTSAGMAGCIGRNFLENYRLCKKLYDDRSRATHEGRTPEDATEARYFAMRAIEYVSIHRGTLKNKRAIRSWVQQFVDQVVAAACVTEDA